MQTFLSRVAQTAILEYSDCLGDLTIVLPNRRAIVFLKNEFKLQLSKSSWLPNFFSLEDFVQEIGGYQKIDSIDLIISLYEIHKEIEKENVEPFSDFLNWGTTLIQDFNEVDRYLVKSSELFGFISEAKALEIWNVEGGELSNLQHNYLKFWKSLETYYEKLRAKLELQNLMYQGLGFRKVAETIESCDLKNYKHVYFVGFNALTKAEQHIIDHFTLKLQAKVFWDADEYYIKDKQQEAGVFLRSHKEREKGDFFWITNDLLIGEKDITIHGISGNIGQAKLIGNLIQGKAEGSSLEKTAVVLADENLLLPSLEAIPMNVRSINVTMGFPIVLSPFHKWFEEYINLFKESGQQKEEKECRFYHKSILSFLKNPSFQKMPQRIRVGVESIIQEILKHQFIFVEANRLASIEKILKIQNLFIGKFIATTIISNCLSLIDVLLTFGGDKISSFEKETLFIYTKCFNRLKELNNNTDLAFDVETLVRLFNEVISKESIDFVGEPLSGLQVMGVLESRTLDFEHVIISSVNEGVLPSGKSQNSFIPFDIKRKFGLPIYKEKDAIFSYHFYRLLQRAKRVDIIYNTKVDQLQGGEMSRFILQLQHELPKKNVNATVNSYIVSPSFNKNNPLATEIAKSEKTIDRIKNHLTKGLSPSAINTFLRCELDYYYKYILGLKEQKVLEEKVENSTFGTIVHNSLEKIYQPYVSHILDQVSLTKMKERVEEEVLFQFKEILNVQPIHGNHRLTYEVAKTFVNNLIAYDLAEVKKGNEIQLLKIEEPFLKSFEVDIEGLTQKVCLKGKIDRVDLFNGKRRIIDYKTGGVSSSDLSYSTVDILVKGKKDKAIQVLLYALAYLNEEDSKDISTGIISLKNISSGFIALKEEDKYNVGLEVLFTIAEKMINSSKFVHNSESEYCVFCC